MIPISLHSHHVHEISPLLSSPPSPYGKNSQQIYKE
jgi:hypothetical protein